MHVFDRRRSAGRALGAAAAIVALVAIWAPTLARADGDPASDVLIFQKVFVTPDAGLTLANQAQLEASLVAVAKRGFPIRVAVVPQPADLGSVSQLWRRPALYAHFLEIELSFNYRGAVLVAMPNGFGLYSGHPLTSAEYAALARLPRPGQGPRLAARVLAAVEALAAAAGHPISAPAAVRPPPQAGTDPEALVAFIIGALLIIAAWTASLRARPLRAAPASESS